MTSVYLGGLPGTIPRQEILGHLSLYGRVSALNIQKGYTFVEYESEADARDLVKTFAHQPLMGYDVRVQLAKKPRRQSTSSTPSSEADRTPPRSNAGGQRVRYPVVVNNLNTRTCWQELKDFGKFAGGTVAFCDIDKSNRQRGFLEYYTQEEADRFVEEANGRELLGNTVSLIACGRQTLRPEHGPPRSRSPASRHQGQRSVTAFPGYSDGTHARSRSRSQSPLSSRRHEHNQASRSTRYSPLRRDRELSPYYADPYHSLHSPRLDVMAENHELSYEAGQVAEYKTSYYLPDDYLDPSDERRAGLDAQWQEYHMPPSSFS